MGGLTAERLPGAEPQELGIGGFIPLTSLDYPGELAAVVFCQGCPWRCRYCHNAHLIPWQAKGDISWSGILGFLRRRVGLLDALVFSGGEPTLQQGLGQAMAQVQAMGFKVGLHSAGIYPERLAKVLEYTDWIGLDVKATPDAYEQITGVPGSGERAWASVEMVLRSGLAYELRTTIHPWLFSPGDLGQLAARLAKLGATRLVLQPCINQRSLDPGLRAAPGLALPPYRLAVEQAGLEVDISEAP